MTTKNLAFDIAQHIQQIHPDFHPQVACVLGSGLGHLVDIFDDKKTIAYQDIPNFPQCSVQGHHGQFVLGQYCSIPIICMQGRIHAYEGGPPEQLRLPIHVLKLLGCKILFLTNAAGSIKEDMLPGSLMALNDHINLSGFNPLVGTNDEKLGPRFPDLSNAYDKDLRRLLFDAAESINIPLNDGVYAFCLGPSFETPAEIKMLRTLGANAVGMSTAPETIVARHCGLKVVAVSAISNLAEGLGTERLTHEHTLKNALKAGKNLAHLFTAFMKKIAEERSYLNE